MGGEARATAHRLCQEAAAQGGVLRVTVRSLRNAFGYARLTDSARREIAAALESEGLDATPSLVDAGLDDALVLRLGGAHLKRPPWWRRTVRGGVKGWQVLVAVLGLAGTVVGLYSFADQRLQEPPGRPALSGDLRIVVAQFRVVDSQGQPRESQQGGAFARTLHTALERRLRAAKQPRGAPYEFGIRGPDEVEAVRGEDPAARARSAGTLARENPADIVLYGDIRATEHETWLFPEIYVTQSILTGAEELAGRYGLGAPIHALGSIEGNAETRRLLRTRLVDRTRALAEFILGVGQFTDANYVSAARRFRAAARAPGQRGKAVVLLFLGNAELRSGRLEPAETAYRRALTLEPDYARARFGLAEVTFQQACPGAGSADRAGLQRAIGRYERVLRARVQPGAFPMQVKTNLGIGKANLCMTPPDCAVAETHFDRVIADYRAGRSRLRDETAEAWGGLGVALELCADARFTTAKQRRRETARRYEEAARVALLPSRRAFYWSHVARVASQLGDVARATSAYDEALAVEPSRELRARYRAARAALSDGRRE